MDLRERNDWSYAKTRLPGFVKVSHYKLYYRPIYKNAHSTMMDIFQAPPIQSHHGPPDVISKHAFTILRHPIDRWMSAMNMLLHSDWRKPKKVPFKADQHMMPQILWFEKMCPENIRFYDMKDGFIHDIIKKEKIFRFNKYKKHHLNEQRQYIGVPLLQMNSDRILEPTRVEKAYNFLQNRKSSWPGKPEWFFLHKTADETMSRLSLEYEEDILFYNSRKFVNR